jgi:hypothetical protein
MIKNTVFALFLIACLFVLFTNVGFETALAMVGRGLDMMIAYVNHIP